MTTDELAVGQYNNQDDQVELEMMKESEQSQFAIAVRETGISPSKGEYFLAQFQPFMSILHELEEAVKELHPEDETEAARLLSVYVHNRTDADRKREELKQASLLEGRAIQSIYKVIESMSKLTEDKLRAIRDAKAIAEKQRVEKLHSQRFLELSAYVDANNYAGLGLMEEEKYQQILADAKLAKQAREEQEQKRLAQIEADRIASEKLKAEHAKLQAEAAKVQLEREKEARLAKEREDALKTKLKAEKEAREKVEAEAARVKAEEAEKQRLALLAPDKEKIKAYATRLKDVLETQPPLTDSELLKKVQKSKRLIESIINDLLVSI